MVHYLDKEDKRKTLKLYKERMCLGFGEGGRGGIKMQITLLDVT